MTLRTKYIWLVNTLGVITLIYGFIIFILTVLIGEITIYNSIPNYIFYLLSLGGVLGIIGLWILLLVEKFSRKLKIFTTFLLCIGIFSALKVANFSITNFGISFYYFPISLALSVGLPILVVVTIFAMYIKMYKK